MEHSRLLLPSALALLACLPGYGQSVLSVHSGVVNYFEGTVLLDDQPLGEKFGTFPSIKEGSMLRTDDGRAEVLLTPGVFLRIDENSGLRMISTSLSDTQAELVSGSAILDSLEASSDKSPLVVFKNSQIRCSKKGVYRFDSEPASVLRVYKGEAEVTQDGKKSVVDASHLYFFAAAAATSKFGDDTDDEFSRWAEQRSGAVAAENQLSAETAQDPSDPNSDGADPSAPGTVFGSPSFGLPNYGSAPGISPWGGSPWASGGFFAPYLPAGAGPWGLFPVAPLYIIRPYRNPAYPYQPTHQPWYSRTTSWQTWRSRPGYPHSSTSAIGISNPLLPHSSGLTPRPITIGAPRPSVSVPVHAATPAAHVGRAH